MNRGWTVDGDSDLNDSDRAYLDELMVRWSAIHTEIESEGFRRQADAEEGNEPYFETDQEYAEYEQHLRNKDSRRRAEIDVIEGLLHSKGARVMRPYEHWNEDEHYMEYMERDR